MARIPLLAGPQMSVVRNEILTPVIPNFKFAPLLCSKISEHRHRKHLVLSLQTHNDISVTAVHSSLAPNTKFHDIPFSSYPYLRFSNPNGGMNNSTGNGTSQYSVHVHMAQEQLSVFSFHDAFRSVSSEPSVVSSQSQSLASVFELSSYSNPICSHKQH